MNRFGVRRARAVYIAESFHWRRAALVYRNEPESIVRCACYHPYYRARLREEFLIVSQDCGESIN